MFGQTFGQRVIVWVTSLCSYLIRIFPPAVKIGEKVLSRSRKVDEPLLDWLICMGCDVGRRGED